MSIDEIRRRVAAVVAIVDDVERFRNEREELCFEVLAAIANEAVSDPKEAARLVTGEELFSDPMPNWK
jgi:hypothetical protein